MSERPKALISVYDKAGIAELARALSDAGYEIVSSSGTAACLRDSGVEVTEVVDVTGVPSILGGRVKTLHPRIMGGILARRGNESDARDMAEHGIPLIDIVVCTLYPFEATARGTHTTQELIEKIDIGGVSLIRAAAKNHASVAVVTDQADYELLTRALKSGGVTEEQRKRLAVKAFLATAFYDATIHEGLAAELGVEEDGSALALPLRKTQHLRYGENPYQTASLYMPALADPPFVQHSGKELSYNNLLDLDTLIRGGLIFAGTESCVIVKHTTPCGAATAGSLPEAYDLALASDPVSAFGGIVGFTGKVDLPLVQKLAGHFYEILAAPEITPDAIEFLKGKKKNLRVLTLTGEYRPPYQITGNRSGFLAQGETPPPVPVQSEGHWAGTPRPELWDELIFAWRVASLTKSNAIILASGGASVGIGSGFPNRVDAAKYAISLAGDRAKGSVMASDAFFPFPDTVEIAAEAGVKAIIQPGGSIRDAEVEKRAAELGIDMFVGGTRTFRH
jgi:phosphoribosylaminoimidazolecarboxamide formyltransferase/IMP cyclohydrolase